MPDAAFWPWWMGGTAVALFAVLYPVVTGRLLGVSSIYTTLLELIPWRRHKEPAGSVASLDELERALLAETEAEFGPLPEEEESPADDFSSALDEAVAPRGGSRSVFLIGLVLGGLLAHFSTGAPLQVASLGHLFDQRFHAIGVGGAVVALFGSGILIGFGTRMAGGCTSGHGISGIARGERGSLVSTATFWSVGVVIAWLLYFLSR